MEGDHTYKVIEIVGSSKTGIEDAVRTGIKRASKNVDELKWFEVDELRGWINDGDVGHWQVKMKVGFTLKD
ncbi:dodecin [uncultured Abyssibacter sp.]|uniref:dodecin n=1 Tax=uncultured Abyssibacter sp. TaxID=2320202 RepID=UPI0032B23F75